MNVPPPKELAALLSATGGRWVCFYTVGFTDPVSALRYATAISSQVAVHQRPGRTPVYTVRTVRGA